MATGAHWRWGHGGARLSKCIYGQCRAGRALLASIITDARVAVNVLRSQLRVFSGLSQNGRHHRLNPALLPPLPPGAQVFSEAVQDLQTDYLDLMLLHYPECWGELCGGVKPEGTWQDRCLGRAACMRLDWTCLPASLLQQRICRGQTLLPCSYRPAASLHTLPACPCPALPLPRPALPRPAPPCPCPAAGRRWSS